MLEFQELSKSFSGVEVLHSVSFSIEQGSVAALVGENGAGKSTLMKVLAGVITDYTGGVFFNGKQFSSRSPKDAQDSGIGIIHQELSVIPDLSVAENIFLGREPLTRIGFVNKQEIITRADAILKDFDFPYSSSVRMGTLPIGWQQIAEIAHALSLDAGIIIMDEPTSALSESEISHLFEKIKLLKARGKTIIYISHRLEEIFSIADSIVVLRDGTFIGKYPASEVSPEFLIERMVGKIFSVEKKLRANFPSSAEVLTAKNLSVSFGNSEGTAGGTVFLQNITMSVRQGEIIGIAGLMGSGRSEFLKFLFGAQQRITELHGELLFWNKPLIPESPRTSIQNGIFLISNDRKGEGIFPELNVITNTSIANLDAYSRSGFVAAEQETHAVQIQSDMLRVKTHSLNNAIQTLSGGNQQKVLLARALLPETKLLLLDEPTRGVDVGAKEEIYGLLERLRAEGMSIIVSSSEIPELLRLCDSITVFAYGKQTALLDADKTDAKEILQYAFLEETE